MPKPNDTYPGTETGGKYCASCHFPIDSNYDCHCGWNHKSKKPVTHRAQLFVDEEPTEEKK